MLMYMASPAFKVSHFQFFLTMHKPATTIHDTTIIMKIAITVDKREKGTDNQGDSHPTKSDLPRAMATMYVWSMDLLDEEDVFVGEKDMEGVFSTNNY